MPVYRLILYGELVTTKASQARVIIPKHGGKPFARVYKPSKVDKWQNSIIMQMAQEHFPTLHGAVGVRLIARFQRPLSHPKTKTIPHIVKPDLDNIYGRIMDAIEHGPGLFARDQQIVSAQIEKVYADAGEPTSITIEVWEAEQHGMTVQKYV